jgi:hypothetical protein
MRSLPSEAELRERGTEYGTKVGTSVGTKCSTNTDRIKHSRNIANHFLSTAFDPYLNLPFLPRTP